MQLLENNKNKILNDYNSGVTLTKLSVEYNVSRWSIKQFLIKNKIKVRDPSSFRIKYNENFFTKKSDNLYYFWGFVLGDGSLISNRNNKIITISLNIKDVCILQNFCDWLNIDYSNIKYYQNNTVCRLNIYSKRIDKNLFKYGIVPNKTYNPVKPIIPKKYIKPFLLGLLDADGHINFTLNKHYDIDIVGNNLIMNWYEQQIKNLGFKGSIKYFFPKNKWKRIRVRRKQDVIDLAKILNINKYYSILLERKWKNIYNYIKSQKYEVG